MPCWFEALQLDSSVLKNNVSSQKPCKKLNTRYVTAKCKEVRKQIKPFSVSSSDPTIIHFIYLRIYYLLHIYFGFFVTGNGSGKGLLVFTNSNTNTRAYKRGRVLPITLNSWVCKCHLSTQEQGLVGCWQTARYIRNLAVTGLVIKGIRITECPNWTEINTHHRDCALIINT